MPLLDVQTGRRGFLRRMAAVAAAPVLGQFVITDPQVLSGDLTSRTLVVPKAEPLVIATSVAALPVGWMDVHLTDMTLDNRITYTRQYRLANVRPTYVAPGAKDLRVYLEAVVSDVSDLEQITAVFNEDQPLTRLYFSR